MSRDDQNSNREDEDEESSEEVIKDSVIQHLKDGKCCTDMLPAPRERLGARSLPGRSIENRNLSVDPQTSLGTRSRTLPGRLVEDGDVIRYLSGYLGDEQQWLRATVQPMTLTQQRKYPTLSAIFSSLLAIS